MRRPLLRRWQVAGLSLLFLGNVLDGQVLLHDDFDGTSLNSNLWHADLFLIGRTDFSMDPVVSGGLCTLRLDTYDPSAPGVLFHSTQLGSNALFAVGAGIEFESRMRILPGTPRGIVDAFFTYHFNETTATADEIDYEFLTNYLDPMGESRMLLTTWNNWDYVPSHANDGIHMATVFPLVPGWDPYQFNTYVIRWLPDRVEWVVNGTTVQTLMGAVPDEPMALKADIWVPDSSWPLAFDFPLQPTANPALNQTYAVEIDSITVRAIPEPSARGLLMVGAAFMLFWMTRRCPMVLR